MFTDGSRMEDGAVGYAVVWKNGQTWEGIKGHMGCNQEAYDAECAALARALESVSGGYIPKRQSSLTRKRPSDGWHRRNLAQDSNTPSKRGSTSPHCAGSGQASPSRPGGAQLIRE